MKQQCLGLRKELLNFKFIFVLGVTVPWGLRLEIQPQTVIIPATFFYSFLHTKSTIIPFKTDKFIRVGK